MPGAAGGAGGSRPGALRRPRSSARSRRASGLRDQYARLIARDDRDRHVAELASLATGLGRFARSARLVADPGKAGRHGAAPASPIG